MHERSPGNAEKRGRPRLQEHVPALTYEVDGTHLLDYLRLLYRRRRLAVAVFLIVFVSAFVYAVTATPTYEATVRLQIETEAPNVLNFGEVAPDGTRVARSEFYRTQYEILRSRSLARITMNLLELWDDPEFLGSDEERFFNPVAWAVGLVSQPDTVAVEGETRAESQAISAFLAGLDIDPIRDSRIVDVTFSSPSPKISAKVANTLAQAYIDQDLAFRHTSSQDASAWLWERLEEQRQRVESAELAMQRYREANHTVSLDKSQNVIGQELADLNEAATRATTERIAKEARYRELTSVQDNTEALGRFPEVVGNALVQDQKLRLADLRRDESRLAEDLGDLHPDLIRVRSAIRNAEVSLRAEITKIVDSVRTEFEIARNLELGLHETLQEQTGEALAQDRVGIEYGVLVRDAESARRVYESLLRRADETGITSELRTTAIRIVDEAEVPLQPVRPRRGRTVIYGFLFGLLAGAGLAFVVETVDDRLKTPEEVRGILGQPCLGMLPTAAVDDSKNGETLFASRGLRLGSNAPEHFAAAVRVICTSVFFSSAEEGCRTVVITSAEPAEGKTVVSCNLAIAIAQAGRRTLLVDADMLRSQQHAYWNRDVAPGLSDLLVGEAQQSEVIRETDVEGLWLLTGGTRSPNPTALLASSRFESLLVSLRESFDWIVFDTPPTLPVSDATLCARSVSHVVVVVDSGSTSRRSAAAALDRLIESGASIAGVVLNQVDLEAHPYYYSPYYRQAYRHYYQNA